MDRVILAPLEGAIPGAMRWVTVSLLVGAVGCSIVFDPDDLTGGPAPPGGACEPLAGGPVAEARVSGAFAGISSAIVDDTGPVLLVAAVHAGAAQIYPFRLGDDGSITAEIPVRVPAEMAEPHRDVALRERDRSEVALIVVGGALPGFSGIMLGEGPFDALSLDTISGPTDPTAVILGRPAVTGRHYFWREVVGGNVRLASLNQDDHGVSGYVSFDMEPTPMEDVIVAATRRDFVALPRVDGEIAIWSVQGGAPTTLALGTRGVSPEDRYAAVAVTGVGQLFARSGPGGQVYREAVCMAQCGDVDCTATMCTSFAEPIERADGGTVLAMESLPNSDIALVQTRPGDTELILRFTDLALRDSAPVPLTEVSRTETILDATVSVLELGDGVWVAGAAQIADLTGLYQTIRPFAVKVGGRCPGSAP